MARAIQRGWEQPGWINHLLYPLSLGYAALMRLRGCAYRAGVLARHRLPVPLIVVGNLSVGGVGKTPLVIELAAQLKARGARPGVIARGYRARAGTWPREADADADAAAVGDEPALIARRCRVPVMVGPNRLRSARALLERHGCDVLLSDDGFQHLALQSHVDIVVIDGARRFGNGWCLPAGPLREPPSALARAGLVVVVNGAGDDEYAMTTHIDRAVRIGLGDDDPEQRMLRDFAAAPVHAVAGIGHPERFFQQLAAHGIEVIAHEYPDHHAYSPADFAFADADANVLMTEKDAVKCAAQVADGSLRGAFWAVPLQVEIAPALLHAVLARIGWGGAGES